MDWCLISFIRKKQLRHNNPKHKKSEIVHKSTLKYIKIVHKSHPQLYRKYIELYVIATS